MVMWGHVIKNTNPLFNWICTFHVPVFLVLSGLLFSIKNKGFSSFKHTVIKILWPYLVFSIFATITDALLTYGNSGSITSACKMILIDGYKTIVLYGIHALWYLGSYIIAVWIYLKIKELLIRRRIVLEVIFIFGGILFSCISDKYKMPAAISLLLASCLRSLVCSVFLFCGSFLFKMITRIRQREIFSLGIILLMTSLLCAELNGKSNFSTVDYGKFPLLCFTASFLGAIGLCLIFNERNISFLSYFGRNSLILLVTHSSLKITVISQFIVGKFMDYKSYLFGIICLAVMIGIEMPIIVLLNGKLNFLVNMPQNFINKIKRVKES